MFTTGFILLINWKTPLKYLFTKKSKKRRSVWVQPILQKHVFLLRFQSNGKGEEADWLVLVTWSAVRLRHSEKLRCFYLEAEKTSASLPLWARIPRVYIWNNELERAKDAICERPLIKPHRKISKEPTANYSSGFWRHSSPTLYPNNCKAIQTNKYNTLATA